jgi:hypothetical protein
VSASTGPVLAAGATVIGNAVIVHDMSWASQARVAVGTTIVAVGLSLAERVLPRTAVAFSWLVLASVLLVRADPKIPSPLESFAQWWGVPAGPGAGHASSRPFK